MRRRLPAASVIRGLLALALGLGLCACANLMGIEKAGDVEPRFIFYPPEPETPRLQFLGSFSSDTDVLTPLSPFQRFILGERESSQIAKPYGVAIHDGKIFACDIRGAAVVIFDLRNRSVSFLGKTGRGRLKKPINLAIDSDGTRYVADPGLGRIMVYDRDDRYVTALGEPDAWDPADVAIHGDRLYVTDLDGGQVVVLDKASGREIRRIAERGSGKGKLFFPTNLEVDADGNIYVADTGNFRVVKFDPDGNEIQAFGSLGRRLGQFVRPKGVALDREGRLYVADAAFDNVQVFDREGNLLLFFGSAGMHRGAMNLPAQVEIDYENTDVFADRLAPGYEIEYVVLVTSQFGRHKVSAYGFLKQTGGEASGP